MSLTNFVKDVFTGNWTNAEARFKDWWTNTAPAWLKTLVGTVETNEGKILQGLLPIAAQDVISGGFTTASFIKALKDVGSQLAKQNITMANTIIMASLNAAVMQQAAAAGVPVPTNMGTPAVIPPVADPATAS